MCRENAGLAQQIEDDLKAANNTLKEQTKQLETERKAFQQENGLLHRRLSALELKVLDLRYTFLCAGKSATLCKYWGAAESILLE